MNSSLSTFDVEFPRISIPCVLNARFSGKKIMRLLHFIEFLSEYSAEYPEDSERLPEFFANEVLCDTWALYEMLALLKKNNQSLDYDIDARFLIEDKRLYEEYLARLEATRDAMPRKIWEKSQLPTFHVFFQEIMTNCFQDKTCLN